MTAEAVTVCPWCLRVNELATSPKNPEAVPRPGDASICIDCGGVAIFDRDTDGAWELRLPTPDELTELVDQGEARGSVAGVAVGARMNERAPAYLLTVHQVLGNAPTARVQCWTEMGPDICGACGQPLPHGGPPKPCVCHWREDATLEPLEDTGLAIARVIALWTTHAAEQHAAGVAAALSSPVVEPPGAPLD